jgi:hypothetical protein
VVAAAALAVLAAVAGAWFGWRAAAGTAYAQAVATMPDETLRATYTDWAGVRSAAGGDALGAASTAREVERFLADAYEQDLTSTSAVVGSTYAMERLFGFSPLTATWEMYGQSRAGAVVVLRFGESVDLAGAERNLRSLGYRPPAEGAGQGGVWEGSVDLVARLDRALTPVFQNVVVLPEEGLVLLSDGSLYAGSSAAVVAGDAASLASVAGVEGLAEAAGEPVSAVLWARDFACEALGMADASDEDRALAEQLLAQAGGVSPLTGVVLALQPDRSLLVGMHFESADQASEDLRPRVELATGEAAGQGGSFGERFRVVEAVADGQLLVMDLEPVAADLPLLSDLSAGPLLFASC